MMRLAFDGITGFSSAPLKVSFYMGFFATLVGLGVLVWSILEKFLSPLFAQDRGADFVVAQDNAYITGTTTHLWTV